MIPIAAAAVEGATLVAGDGGRRIQQVTADSRAVIPGSLFVALRGRSADGHDHVEAACRAGAAAVLGARGRLAPHGAVAMLEAEDPLTALGVLARQVRRVSAANIVGVAGSAGKTSTKDILRALCAPHVATVATHANHNNELGVPLTLCRIEPATGVCVAELAMRARGEVAALCAVAEPDVGVITNIGPEHLEFLGSVEEVAAAQAELLEALPDGAVAVVPAGEPLLRPHLRAGLRTLSFGDGEDAAVAVRSWEQAGGGSTRARLVVEGVALELRTNLVAAHQRLNLAAAVAAYVALGLPLAGVGEGAAAIQLSPWRGQERRLAGGGVVINDSYNANPASMAAALDSLVARAGGRRTVAVLGGMAELGPDSAAYHREVGGRVARLGIDVLLAVGELAREYVDAAAGRVETRWCATLDDAQAVLPELVEPGDVVLLKASRALGLERLDAVLA